MHRRLALLAAAACCASTASADDTFSLASVLNISCASNTCDVWASVSGSSPVPLRLSFYAPQIVRWWLAIDGNFSDTGAASDVIVGGASPVTAVLEDAGSYYRLTQSPPSTSPAVEVHLSKSPPLLTVLANGQAVMQESVPLSWNSTSSWQTVARDAAPLPPGLSVEWFFGVGMQHGSFSHRDTAVGIGVDYNWDDGGHPNAVPWYVSSAGYGVLRNTWAPGLYNFSSPVSTAHNESNRLDAFILVADPAASTSTSTSTIKDLLGLYTAVTGPPFLPPLYGLFLGDSDCYHNDRHGNSTQVAIAVAQEYQDNDMPHGWMLVNDGYGCGYGEGPSVFPSNLTDLTYVVAELHSRGMYTGLWTSTGMPNIQDEVGIAGTRVCKTDVGWIGAGYKYAFDGVSLCAGGIEQYSTPPARRFVWTVEGWAGTHRLAVMWTGDNSGSMDYVRWQLPSFVGAGFSAQAHVSGDLDGIFGGSPESQVRDLQAKSLMTTLMTMSGWAANPDKQPWTWGEPYTSINRASLKLKARLTPYIYSNSREAYDNGVPPVRALALEFPADEATYTPTNGSSYSYMSGPFLLASPVFTEGAVTRDSIYLPAGTIWVDWWNGTRYAGGQTIDGYPAPLDVLPIFVRAGAVIPMWPAMNYFNEAPADPMYIELWPSGNSSFTLYEDDGVTRDALPPTNSFARTLISVAAPANYLNSTTGAAAGNVTITVGPASGTFSGQLASRGWWLNVRSLASPLEVLLLTDNGNTTTSLPPAGSEAELEYMASGWYWDPSLQLGLLMIKVPSQLASAGFSLTLSNGPSFPKIGTETCDTPGHHQVENQRFAYNTTDGTIAVLAQSSNDPTGLCITVGEDNDPDSHTPAIEVQTCSAAASGRQQFSIVQASKQITLTADASTCLDQDVSVNRVIAYGCHDPSTPGNQAWDINPDGSSQHIVSVQNGLCMAVLQQQ